MSSFNRAESHWKLVTLSKGKLRSRTFFAFFFQIVSNVHTINCAYKKILTLLFCNNNKIIMDNLRSQIKVNEIFVLELDAK